jgi:FOG: TPR repeat, SEL1 subfamily
VKRHIIVMSTAFILILWGRSLQPYSQAVMKTAEGEPAAVSADSSPSANADTDNPVDIVDQVRLFVSSFSRLNEQGSREDRIAYFQSVIKAEMERSERNNTLTIEAARRLLAEVTASGFEEKHVNATSVAITVLGALCDDGVAPACNLLGLLVQDGIGLQRSNERAVSYFWFGARLGSSDSLSNLAVQLYENAPVQWSDAETVAILRIVIELNPQDDQAMLYLGHAYAEGRGVTKDIDQAREWYGRAVENGSDWAKPMLKKYAE